MGLQIIGAGGAVQEVDAAMKAARVSIRPQEVLAWQSLGIATGALTTVAAGGAIFSLRNISSNLLIIRRVGIGLYLTAGFTAGQAMQMALQVARAFTASDTGGTAIALTGSNAKHRTSLATLTSVDCRVSTTGALTAGTKTLDANYLGILGAFAATTTAGTVIASAQDNLLAHTPGDHPLVLAQNEGINIINPVLWGAGATGAALVNLEFAEASAY